MVGSDFVRYTATKEDVKAATGIDPGPSVRQLFDKLSSNVGDSKIGEVRTFFLRSFLGQKLLDPLPRCPIESMFWDWEFSYYPDNEMSSVR